jgi:eukaryotic-like serine/threonine-protein kinase
MRGQTISGRYKILEELGGGAFGTTYIAEDLGVQTKIKSRCVVKKFSPKDNNPEVLEIARRLFNEEALALQQLGRHDQIPQLLAYFEENRQFYLVLELIEGDDLEKLLLKAPYSQEEVIVMIRDILEALQFVQKKNCIHRDLKPSNLIKRNNDNKIVLIDFGAVKQIGTQVVASAGGVTSTVVIGTQGYMAPEQASGHPTFSSDIYSLGIIAIQALTGKQPQSLSFGTTGELLWRDRLPSGQKYTQKFLAFLDKMVRYHFRERYASATDALKALDEVSSASTTLLNRITKMSSSSKGNSWLRLLGICAALLIFGAIGYKGITSILTPSTKFAVYEDNEFQIKLDYPENWAKQKRDEIFFKGIILIPDDSDINDTTRNNLSVNIEDLSSTTVSLAQYTDSAVNEIKKFAEANNIVGPTDITVASNQGVKVIFSTIENGKELKKMQIWTLRQNKAYIITYTADRDKFDRYNSEVERVIKSFEIE